MKTIAIFGAGGKMGLRAVDKLKDDPNYRVLCVEVSERGLGRLAERSLSATPAPEASATADVVILAVPDKLIGRIAPEIVPLMKPGAMLMLLDPAAAHGGELPMRKDLAYFIAHPCHPPLVSDEVGEARYDFFGGIAKQHMVCALMQGTEADYALGEAMGRLLFGPIMNAYRITVEQMAILEPALVETTILALLAVIREAIDEAVKAGVPAEAAREFALGHMNVAVGMLFGYSNTVFSDGALLAMAEGKKRLMQPDWKDVFAPASVLAQVKAITQAK